MGKQSVYTSIIKAKNGTYIPVFSDNRTVDSKYNPEREAEKVVSNIVNELTLSQGELRQAGPGIYGNVLCFLVTGIASGILIETLTRTFPNSKVIAVEGSCDDLDFLSELDKVKGIKENKNVVLTYIDNIENVLVNNYLPAMYEDFKIVEQIGWLQEHKESVNILNKKINKAMGIISADYSVQSHFGKIWQTNIMNNLKNMSFAEEITYTIKRNDIINKTAAIIAAGPSLDKTIRNIKNNKDKYFIISTDTALPSLVKNNIYPDIAISIDGQHISHNHFMQLQGCRNTVFLIDLCSDYSVGQYLQNNKYKLAYFISGHPLSALSDYLSDIKFIRLFSGAGTVTISAVDMALKLGFTKLEIYGADFSYSEGKAYTKGTYFDTLFQINNSIIRSSELQYLNIYFRSELNKISENEYSTDILTAYRMSLEQFLSDNNCSFEKDNFIYKINCQSNIGSISQIRSFPYNYRNFLSIIKSTNMKDLAYPLMPYIAWLKNKKANKSLKFIALLKLAQSNIVGYN